MSCSQVCPDVSFVSGAPELRDGDLSGGTLHPGPGAGLQGDGGHLPQHARPGGLGGAPRPAVRLPLLAALPHLPYLVTQVREDVIYGDRTVCVFTLTRCCLCWMSEEVQVWLSCYDGG